MPISPPVTDPLASLAALEREMDVPTHGRFTGGWIQKRRRKLAAVIATLREYESATAQVVENYQWWTKARQVNPEERAMASNALQESLRKLAGSAEGPQEDRGQ